MTVPPRSRPVPRVLAPGLLALLLGLPPVFAADEPAPAAPAAEAATANNPDALRLNFKGAPFDSLLDYLSEAGGFIIVRDGMIPGTVDIVSHQPMTRDEVVELLHTLLNDRGYALVRSNRILRIVKREDARFHDLPVVSGADPTAMKRSDEVITQIIPIKHTTAEKLIENLKPLLPANSLINANADSNSLIITDTRTNIKRMAEIVKALDTAVSNILDVKVIPLQYADAEQTAAVINKVFETPASSAKSSQSNDPRAQFFQRFRGGGGRDGGGDNNDAGNANNDAREMSSHVAAVADPRANAVVVTAPTEVIAQIQVLVVQLDQPAESTSTLRVFPLRYASATEIAAILTGIYTTNASTTAATNGNNNQGGFGGRRGFFGQQQQQTTATTSTSSERKLAEAKVTAVADTRTNAVIVSASPATMDDIGEMLKTLDATPANVPTVYIYQLDNADITTTRDLLRSMFDDLDGAGSSSTSGNTATGNRAAGTTTNRNGAATGRTGTGNNSGTTGTRGN